MKGQGDPPGGLPGNGVHGVNGADGGTGSLARGVNRKRRKCRKKDRMWGIGWGFALSLRAPLCKHRRALSDDHAASAEPSIP